MARAAGQRTSSSHDLFSGKTPPPKPRNADRRPREYLAEAEVERLMKAARGVGRHGHRDPTLILLAFRHGLRVGEVVRLRWSQVHLGRHASVDVLRLKGGVNTTHPLWGAEVRALRQLRREYPEADHVFASERGGPLTESAVGKLIRRAGELAGLPFPVHPHMLRHGCGFKLANEGVDTRALQAYLGHRSIQHTVRYTELAPTRFNGFWKD